MSKQNEPGHRDRLVALRDEILEQILAVESSLHRLEEGREIEYVDRAQLEDQELLLARLDDRRRYDLHEIEAALDRLAEGRFGRCELCGRRIAATRLRALPTARHCRPCAEAAESGA